MGIRTGTVTFEGAGAERHVPLPVRTGEDVAAAVAGFESRPDVTITIEMNDADERLLIAVDGFVAFVGLDREDGMFQFATQRQDAGIGTRELVIGGQPTDIDVRYLMDVSTAAAVAREWFDQVELSLHGWWERC
jgi:hypothetical protein